MGVAIFGLWLALFAPTLWLYAPLVKRQIWGRRRKRRATAVDSRMRESRALTESTGDELMESSKCSNMTTLFRGGAS